MKKTILIWAMLLMTGISYSFANNADGTTESVTTSFKKDFVNAKEVSWETGRVFIKATFKLNEQVTYAYYSPDGELIAITRNILSNQLPINQLMSLNKDYKDYWITELFEVNSNNETSYYITLENPDNKVVLKSANSGNWGVYSKEVKH